VTFAFCRSTRWLQTPKESLSTLKWLSFGAGKLILRGCLFDKYVTFVRSSADRWNEQTQEKKQQVRRLVNEGRLEFINGGHVDHHMLQSPNTKQFIDVPYILLFLNNAHAVGV